MMYKAISGASTIQLCKERCQLRHRSRNESLDDDAFETNQNRKRRKGKQQVYYAVSTVIHKKKTIKERENEVIRRQGTLSNKQIQKFDVGQLRYGGGDFSEQANFHVNGGKADCSDNIGSHPAGESMVKQKNGVHPRGYRR